MWVAYGVLYPLTDQSYGEEVSQVNPVTNKATERKVTHTSLAFSLPLAHSLLPPLSFSLPPPPPPLSLSHHLLPKEHSNGIGKKPGVVNATKQGTTMFANCNYKVKQEC